MVLLAEHKSLLEKFNLNLEQLDYKYIANCNSVKQLGWILRVLRSGEEGTFPHLIKFCEEKLRNKDPNNQLLFVAENIKSYSELPESERQELLKDIEGWSNELSKYKIQNSSFETESSKDLPPIRTRNISMIHKENKMNGTSDENSVSSNGCKPRSYEEWNKYNVDEELKKLDGENIDQTENIGRNVSELSKSVSVANLSQIEREKVADLERIKGNEAYKAQDYEEAAIYYTRSISVFKTAKSLSNRAQAYIKLKSSLAAVFDCNEAISMEPNNVKALYRRGIAHKEAKMYDLAIIDFTVLLEMDPDNISAKEQLQQIEQLKLQETHEKKKLIIEELETDTQNEEINPEKQLTKDRNISTRLTIEEITDTTHRPSLDDLCNCKDDTNQIFSKNTQDMFNVVHNHHLGKSKPVSKLDRTNKQNSNPSKNRATSYEKMLSQFEASKPSAKLESDGTINYKIQEETNSTSPEKQAKFSAKTNNEQPLLKSEIDKSNSLTYKKEQDCNHDNFLIKEASLFGLEHTDENELKTKECKKNSNIGIIQKQSKITPYEFIQVWLSNNANFNYINGATYLLTIKPNHLPQLLTNKLDGPLLNGILMAIDSITRMGKIDEGLEYLNNLIKVPRIKMISLFLSNEEKKSIENMLILMEKKHNLYLSEVREVLTIV